MAEIFVNPNLPKYFVPAPEVTSAETARSYVDEYEGASVVYFPNLKLDIDHDFWGEATTGQCNALKKFTINLGVEQDGQEQLHQHRRKLLAAGVDELTAVALADQMQSIYSSIMPLYRAVFAEYAFERQKVVWRLNTIKAENLHVDTYKEENEFHFARMFINLDNQPRIWQTSWRIEDMVQQAAGRISPAEIAGLSRGETWTKLNKAFFGQTSREWWDDQPRHIAFFDPGDVWLADSRQVSHQIFYGRRALSIDFTVPKEHMRNSDVHYLSIADRFRKACHKSA